MRDDPLLPLDHGEGRQEDATGAGAASGAGPSSPQADGTSADPRADTPAGLSLTPHLADAEEPGLSDEEIAMYRRRVAEGVYDSREVADEIARRIMRRGDI
jgi:hypothetical protein